MLCIAVRIIPAAQVANIVFIQTHALSGSVRFRTSSSNEFIPVFPADKILAQASLQGHSAKRGS
jgi:hypothetical protein